MPHHPDRRAVLLGAAGLLTLPAFASTSNSKDNPMTTTTFTKMPTPAWLLAFWKEIDDKTWGAGFDRFANDSTCHLGVADWHGTATSAGSCLARYPSRTSDYGDSMLPGKS